MVELIKIHNHNNQRLVDARELHEFLQVGKDFSTWIKYRINQYGFIEGSDYTTFPKFGETATGGYKTIEYALTLDTAKELSMVENNERGKQARRYFIHMEKLARENVLPPAPVSRRQLAEMVIEQEKEIEKLQMINEYNTNAIEEMKPKVALMELVLNARENLSIGQVAKILELPFGRNELFQELRDRKILFRGSGGHNEPYQQYIEKGFFLVKQTVLQQGTKFRTVPQIYVTQKGVRFIADQLKPYDPALF